MKKLTLSLDYNLERILDFIQENLHYLDRDLLREYIKQHQKHGTFDYAIDLNSNIVAICRWNIKDNVADVIDFAINKKWRNKKVGRDFILRALKRFPEIEKIKFRRGVRGDERIRTININEVLKKGLL